MKKTFRFFVSAIAVMAALASCVKNEVKVSPEDKTKTVEITASYSDTKTALEDGRYVRWSATDAVKAFGLEQTGYVSKTTEVSEEGSVATFTFDISEDEILYLAYPAANCGSMDGGGNIYFTIPSQQTAVANGFADGANVAIGEIMDGTAKMYNAGALVSFEVKNDDITSIKLEFENAVNAVTGSGYAYYEDKTVLSQGDAINGTAAFNYVEIKAAETFEKGAKYYAVVYPGTYEGMTLTFTRNDGATATFTNSAGLTLAENSNITVFKSEIPADKWESGAAEVIYFKETFDGCDGTGGNDGQWSGNVASSTFNADNDGWVTVKGSGADKCAKFGTGSAQGSATTPAITLPASAGGMAELTFKAAAWDGTKEHTTLNIKVSNGTLSDESVEMTKGAWTDYSLIISGVTENNITITFEAVQSSNNRFFLDDVVVKSYSSSPVEPVAVTGVTLDYTELTLTEEEEFTLTATVNPSNASDKTVVWSSSDKDVVYVDESGNILAMGVGTADITVTTNDGGFTATCTVTVNAADEPLHNISDIKNTIVSTDKNSLDSFSVILDNAVVTYINGRNMYIEDNTGGILYYGTTPAGVTVGTSISGKIKGSGYVFSGLKEITQLDLSEAELGSADVPVTALTPAQLEENYDRYVSCRVKMTDVQIDAANSTVGGINSYVKDKETVTLYDGKGTLICYPSYYNDDIQLNLWEPITYSGVGVTGVTLNRTELTLTEGQDFTLTAEVNPSNATDKTVTWSSSDEDVVMVDNGYILAASVGTAVVTVTTVDGGYTASCTVTVVEAGGEPVEETGTITFGNNGVKINGANVSGTDDLGNTWSITTVGTTSFTGQPGYYQVGSSKSPATSITFKTTLSSSVNIKNITAKFGGFSGTAGNITLKVGDVTVGTGSLSTTNDVEVESTSSEQGQEITITITGIAKGVKCYNITYTYEK